MVIDGARPLRRGAGCVRRSGHPTLPAPQAPQRRRPAPGCRGLDRGQADAGRLPQPDPLVAQSGLEALALDRSHPGAAGSLREGLAETLTIGRLGAPPHPGSNVRSTNSIDAICRDHAANVKRWRDGQMGLRWALPAWTRPASSSVASTATCTCPPCAPRWTRPSLLLHRPRRCRLITPGPPPNLHGERDNLWQPDISTCRVWRFAPIDVFVRIVACNHGPWSGEGESSRVSLRR
jgi:hypothetical protein